MNSSSSSFADEKTRGNNSENSKTSDSMGRNKRIIFLSIALLLFFIGYILAPPSIPNGHYNVELGFDDTLIDFDIEIVDNFDETQQIRSKSIMKSNVNLTATYYNQYPGESGDKLTFNLTIAGTNPSLAELKGVLTSTNSNDINHTFIAKEFVGDTATFEFTILKNTSIALGLLFAISFLWLTEVIPLAVTSLGIPVVLVFLKVSNPTESLDYFSDPIIFLFLAGFLMAEAMNRTKLDEYISLRIFAHLPPNEKILMFSMMVLAAVFSMFMSNTAACAILIPLMMQFLKEVEIESSSFQKAVILGIAYASTVGGIGSLIGTPPNIIATQLLKQFDPSLEINFVEWFLFGLPVVIIMLPIVFVYLWIRFKPTIDREKLKSVQEETKITISDDHQLTQEQSIVSIIFVFIFGLWMTSNIHGISSSIIAIFGAVLLYIFGQLKESDLQNINWNALLTFGGGLTLGALIIQTGLADYIGSKATIISPYSNFTILFVIILIALILTAFASNTASAVILIPIVMPLSFVLNISPMLLAVAVAIGASIDFAIVIGTPPTMIAYSTGLFETKEIFQIGILLDLIGLIIVTVLSYSLFGVFVNWI